MNEHRANISVSLLVPNSALLSLQNTRQQHASEEMREK